MTTVLFDQNPRSECKHHNRFSLTSWRGAPPPERGHVNLCRDCGMFHVFASKEGVDIEVDFWLIMDEHVDAAGKYARFLTAVEKELQL